ncbi:hypothetical protein AAT19DRAFT_8780 [Rhodotorula toruloides]|uniref:Uncharacterized protein n=1 Tax=Rhodotorula toruloides TaxID=5286 RepID=A0A2T0AI97_RHOTO|nr:hypothetical protein AAT19DRAFT_8780 [Rhodotorula toruloides]
MPAVAPPTGPPFAALPRSRRTTPFILLSPSNDSAIPRVELTGRRRSRPSLTERCKAGLTLLDLG